MRKLVCFLLLAGFAVSLFAGCTPKNEPITVITQNVRYCDDPDGNSINRRAKRLNALVQSYQPDILCTQEVTNTWSKLLTGILSDTYTCVGEFDGGPDSTQGNKVAIFFRKERFELQETDTFWLSDTPQEVSKYEDSKTKRICTWALLKDKVTNKTFLVANTHLDTQTPEVRLAQYQVLKAQLKDLFSQYPAILTGDFNAQPDSNVYSCVLQDFRDPHVSAPQNASTVDYTAHGYGTVTDRRIDYCFYNSAFAAQNYQILSDQYDGYVSDHYGVLTKYTFAD